MQSGISRKKLWNRDYSIIIPKKLWNRDYSIIIPKWYTHPADAGDYLNLIWPYLWTFTPNCHITWLQMSRIQKWCWMTASFLNLSNLSKISGLKSRDGWWFIVTPPNSRPNLNIEISSHAAKFYIQNGFIPFFSIFSTAVKCFRPPYPPYCIYHRSYWSRSVTCSTISEMKAYVVIGWPVHPELFCNIYVYSLLPAERNTTSFTGWGW